MAAHPSRLRVTAELSNLRTIRDLVEAVAREGGFPDLKVYDLVLAVDEAATNVIMHGYKTPGAGVIEVDAQLDERDMRVTLRDQAPPFDPTATPVQVELPPLAERMPGGLGIFLMRKTLDEMRYRRTPDGWNELTLIMVRPSEPQEGSNAV